LCKVPGPCFEQTKPQCLLPRREHNASKMQENATNHKKTQENARKDKKTQENARIFLVVTLRRKKHKHFSN
jgi:hypothetical protein